jgi:membrane protein YqaA with SNARE-associated domain
VTADLPAYASLFLISFLAATLLPLSSEAALAGLIASGTASPVVLFLIALTGNTLGSVVNYWLGRGIEHFRDRRWFPVKPAHYAAAQERFARYGLWSLLFAWLPVIGDPLTVVAGALRVRFLTFLALVAIGKAMRYVTIMAGVAWWLS